MNPNYNSTIPEPIARKEIPDAWAKTGRCPACHAAALQVVHMQNAIDYLICAHCELSFEVAVNGGKIRVKNVPESLGFMEGELRYHWVDPPVLGEYLSNRYAIIEERNKAPAPGTLSDADVLKRAASLYEMGNTPKMVQFVLMQAGATQQQAQEAFVKLKKKSVQDAQSVARNLWIAGGILAGIVLVIIGAMVLTPIVISAQVSLDLAKPADTLNDSNVFLKTLVHLPGMLKPGYLREGPAHVEYTGPEQSPCPAWSSHAAALFGGQAGQWSSIRQTTAWQMTSTGAANTIRVPAGMRVVFVDNRSGTSSVMNGPLTISRVNFAAILCQ